MYGISKVHVPTTIKGSRQFWANTNAAAGGGSSGGGGGSGGDAVLQ